MQFCVHGLDSYRPSPVGDIVTRFANGGATPGVILCGLGQTMSGVVVAMRRTLLSCTSLARNGLITLGAATLLSVTPACAEDAAPLQGLLDLNRQEFAVLTTALALLGFSVVAAILQKHTRLRAAKNETRLRSDVQALQTEADRYRALLFAEPQILISWPAGDNRPQISGDITLLLPPDSPHSQPQRILASGTWLPPEPALQMDHALDALREAGEGFLLNLTASNGRAFEAMGRAIGGQAIVRIRELGGLRKELAETHLRHKALLEETEMLRGFAAAAPWPIWTRRSNGGLGYVNAAYARATEAASVADAISRDLELLDSGDRGEMDHALQTGAGFAARLPIVVGGERRFYDVRANRVGGGSAGIAVDASEASALSAALVRMAEAHRRTLDQLSSGVAVFDDRRRLAFYNDSYRRLWDLDRAFLDNNPDDSSVLDRLRAAQAARAAGFSRLEGEAARGLSRGRARKGHLVSARRPRGARRHHAEPGRRRHLSVRRRHREPRTGAAIRRPDPGPARDPGQPRRGGRGVRQQWPRPIVQPGLRQDVEAVARGVAATAAYRDRRSLVPAAVR